MRSFIVLALVGASVAAPFNLAKYFVDKRYHPHPSPTKPYLPGGWPSYPTTSAVIPGPTGTGGPHPPIVPTGTGTESIIPYYPTPVVDRRGLEIDYKLAPRNPDPAYEARHHPRPHPHHPHGTGFPHGTGKPSHFPFPTGTSAFVKPTALPTPPLHIY